MYSLIYIAIYSAIDSAMYSLFMSLFIRYLFLKYGLSINRAIVNMFV